MSEKAFTPGPWRVRIGSSDWGMPKAHLILREHDNGDNFDTWIAEVPSVTPYCLGARRSEVERARSQFANAHLIAAVPDLYSVVDLLLRYEAHDEGEVSGSEMWERLITEARAALARAHGGDQ